MPTFEPVIGLEIHAQLLTDTKIFCGCPARFGAEPNTSLCPVCLGLPGALPVLNERAVEFATRAALALGCQINEVSVFARKHYFYPDLPKGYQISQYDRPLASGGGIAFQSRSGPVSLGLVRVHLEEDAGKSLHDGQADAEASSALDFNRSGVPLIEIVTRPDLRSAPDAAEAFSRIREILVAVGVNDGNMEEGSLRCDANISVRREGDAAFGVKTELKNLNSFRYVQRAIEFEIARHIQALEEGSPILQQTRLWDSAEGRTVVMRTKEESDDYRYFPDPDLPPLVLTRAWIDGVARALPELPDARRARFATQYHLPAYDAEVLTQSMAIADYFERVAARCGNAKAASNWVMGEVARKLKESGRSIDELPITPEALAELILLVDRRTISGSVAKEVFERMDASGRRPADIVREDGLGLVDDSAAIDRAVEAVFAGNAAAVAEYRAGKTKTFGFLVGQVMKAMSGKADPARVNEAVRRALERPSESRP